METLTSEINAALQQGPSGVTDAVARLTAAMATGGILDPASDGFDARHLAAWGGLLGALRSAGRNEEAVRVALAHYDEMCRIQVDRQRRFHKGTATQQTAIVHFVRGDPGVAEWFFMLALVEDILSSGQPTGVPDSHACRDLRMQYGRLDPFFESLAATARDTKGQLPDTGHPQRWWFPEAVLVTLARARALTRATAARTPIPVNRSFLALMASRLDDGTPGDKGKALEHLASYLCLTLPGARLIPNAKAPDHEMDLVVVQAASGPSYLLDVLGRTFLVECKNYSDGVGVEKLNHFVAKMRFHRCSTGVLFAKEGITGGGTPELRAARLTQLRWYEQDGCAVIVVARADIERVASGEIGFAELLLGGYESVRFNLADEARS
jgi:hypothetical protein